jgi:hypothetical protein
MSVMGLIYRQAKHGNFRPIRFYARRLWRGLLAGTTCCQCGKRKKFSLHPSCYACQLKNFKEAMDLPEDWEPTARDSQVAKGEA